jgi:spore germination protein YaaH
VLLFAANQVIKGNAETNKEIVSPTSDSISVFKLLSKQVLRSDNYVVYGYLPYWSLDKAEYLKYDNLTDLAYFGLYIEGDGNFQAYNDDGTMESGYLNWYENPEVENIIKDAQQKGVRVALTIISHNDDYSTSFLNCGSCWDTLINNTYDELTRMGIKDVNLNFEYTTYVDQNIADKYTEFVAYFNKEMDDR